MLAEAPLYRLFDGGSVSGEEERDRLMLDELGLANVSECFSHKASSGGCFLGISSNIAL